jgi:hypothetical protein
MANGQCASEEKPNKLRPFVGFWFLVFVLVFFSLPTLCRAHHLASPNDAPLSAIPIPGLSHGQMFVIARNRTAILELAAREIHTDPTMRRLQAFIDFQFFACLWGMVPGSLEDENSPFNECSHAYLAATRLLLIHLQKMPGDRAPIRALIEKIEIEMLNSNASLVMCGYSDETFNTAEVIGPHWGDVPLHPPTLITFAGLAMASAGCVWMLVRFKPT